jgi:hypothetical protein
MKTVSANSLLYLSGLPALLPKNKGIVVEVYVVNAFFVRYLDPVVLN